MRQDYVQSLEREEMFTVVLEVAHALPGCSGWLLIHLARFPSIRHSRMQLMVTLNKSDTAIRRAVAELVKARVCSVDDQGRAMFAPEGFLE